MEHIWTMLMQKILQNHRLCAFVANLKIGALYALYPKSFCDKNLAIWKVFAFCDSVSYIDPQHWAIWACFLRCLEIYWKAYLKGWAPLGEVKKINGVSCKRFCGTNSPHGSSEDIVMSLIFLPKLLKHTSQPLETCGRALFTCWPSIFPGWDGFLFPKETEKNLQKWLAFY